MLGLGTLTFATPLALGALALLPVIWWLLRFNPPRPQAVRFPPFRLLLDLVSREEQPDRTPWWLLLLRLTLVTLVILAVARPLLVHDEATGLTSERLVIVVDDGWAAARQWPERERMLNQFIDAAERARAPVALVGTAPRAQPPGLQFQPAAETRERAAAFAPRALETDRLALLERLESELGGSGPQVVWLSDGLDSNDATAFAEGLQGLAGGAGVQVIQTPPADLGLAVSPPSLEDGDVHVTIRRPSTAASSAALVRILASNGRSLAERPITFAAGAVTAEEAFSLPLELRNEAARLEIAEERTAAGVHLFDDLWRRKSVGLVSGASQELDQPLLSPLYYVSRALEPTSELRQADDGGLGELLEQNLSMLVVADVGIIARAERERVENWLDGGGVLVRFAGPGLPAATTIWSLSNCARATARWAAHWPGNGPSRWRRSPNRARSPVWRSTIQSRSAARSLPSRPPICTTRYGPASPTAPRSSPRNGAATACLCWCTSPPMPNGRTCRCRGSSWRCSTASSNWRRRLGKPRGTRRPERRPVPTRPGCRVRFSTASAC
jgi:hypothetical protein